MPFGQLVIGPPGSGKTTYCDGMQQYMDAIGRQVHTMISAGFLFSSGSPLDSLRTFIAKFFVRFKRGLRLSFQ